MTADSLCTVPEAVEDLRRGRMIILVDDPDRENEGDLAMLAEHATPEAINFMACEGRGLICLPLASNDCDRLGLEPQVPHNTNPLGTGFTVSIDATDVSGPGISAPARAHTIRRAADPAASRADFRRPGHVFPLRARDGGVLVRAGQTEGIVDLARLAGARRAGVICEIMNEDGSMARMPQLQEFARRHDLRICTIESLIAHRQRTELLIEPLELDVPMPTRFGDFRVHLFRSIIDGREHVVLTTGMPMPAAAGAAAVNAPVLVRVHSECLTGDVFHSLRCDCGAQRDRAFEILGQSQHGVFLYMRQEGRGIGLANKLRAYRLQDSGLDTVEANLRLGLPADSRDYGIGAQILYFLGVRRLRLLTNNPQKLHGLARHGLQIVEQLPLQTETNPANISYLRAKRDKLGHLLHGLDTADGESGDSSGNRLPNRRRLESTSLHPMRPDSRPPMSTIEDQLHQEHHLIDRLCNDLCETLTDRNTKKARRMLRQLRELVNAHFTAEERDWFPGFTARNPRLKARADELMADHASLRRMIEGIESELDSADNANALFLCERLLRTMRGHAQQEELLLLSGNADA